MDMFERFLVIAGLSAVLPACIAVPDDNVIACQNGIAEWAEQYDPLRIDTVSTGRGNRSADGKLVMPLHVRIVYDRQGGPETREADIRCSVGKDGAVVAVM